MRQRIHPDIFFMALAILLGLNLAHAQGIQPTFTPANDQKLDARASAQATSDDEKELKSKGYVQIGTIRASLPGKKETPEITSQLQSAILKKAAEAGGDVVRFYQDGALETAEVATGKTKKECTEHGNAPSTGWTGGTTTYSNSCSTDIHGFQHCYSTPSTSPGHPTGGGIRCTKWEQVPITSKEKSLVSEGAVWRYAPNLAADIAVRTETSARAFAPLFSSLGKDINSPEMKTWLLSLGTPEISSGSFYNYKSEGISLLVDNEHKLSAIFFYSEGADGYRQYQGDLPFGLSFQSTRKEIESVLGRPDASGGKGVINYWTSYRSKGIGIVYNTMRTNEMNARIYHISIQTVP
jgi:hypothetical protein